MFSVHVSLDAHTEIEFNEWQELSSGLTEEWVKLCLQDRGYMPRTHHYIVSSLCCDEPGDGAETKRQMLRFITGILDYEPASLPPQLSHFTFFLYMHFAPFC
jgi:hypothetical protein